ncbi:hypothetical protein BRC62_00280 [Halobacteriales archaeon QH_10_67_13]|nr:MAG: hypothetical protein BRC62_00280 [Halobacteriales archaeon QH_10_67_13]
MATWKRDFASGLVVLVPILVTIVVLAWIYGYLARVPVPAGSPVLEPEPVRVGLSLVVFVLLVFSVGYLMRTAAGVLIEGALDQLINKLPGLRVVYNASKMAVETALSGTSDLQAPVRVEVWDGLQMTAFKTGRTTDDGREILFMPTAPNITTGFVIEAKPDRYTESDESVEEALTRLLSAGFGDTEQESVANMFDDRGGKNETPSPGDRPSGSGSGSGSTPNPAGDGSAHTQQSSE